MANPHPRDLPPEPQPSGASSWWSILSNSAVALMLALAIAVLVFELGGALVAAIRGQQGDYSIVSLGPLPPVMPVNAWGLVAGPVLCLLVGSVMQILQPFRFRGDFAHLLWIWIGGLLLARAAWSLISLPFGGDLGLLVKAWAWPTWTTYMAAVVGALGLLEVARQWAIHSARLCGHDQRRLNCFTLYPWLIALPLVAWQVLQHLPATMTPLLPAEKLSAVVAVAGPTLFAPISLLLTRRTNELEEPLQVGPVPWLGLAGLVVVGALDFAFGAALTFR